MSICDLMFDQLLGVYEVGSDYDRLLVDDSDIVKRAKVGNLQGEFGYPVKTDDIDNASYQNKFNTVDIKNSCVKFEHIYRIVSDDGKTFELFGIVRAIGKRKEAVLRQLAGSNKDNFTIRVIETNTRAGNNKPSVLKKIITFDFNSKLNQE